MAIKLKKLDDSLPGTIISAVKSKTEDPEAQYSTANRWLLCDGQELDYSTNPEYTALYNVIGTKYGTSGGSTFKLPNLHGIAAQKDNVNHMTGVADNISVMRQHPNPTNFTQLSGGVCDETSNRNNTGSGTLSGNTANLEGSLGTTVQSNLQSCQVTGAPGCVSGATDSYAMKLSNVPGHAHPVPNWAQLRQNNHKGGIQNNGSNIRHYRTWIWTADMQGHNTDTERFGGDFSTFNSNNHYRCDGTPHAHTAQITFADVDGELQPTHNVSPGASFNYAIQVNGTPTDVPTIGSHVQLRFYIKF